MSITSRFETLCQRPLSQTTRLSSVYTCRNRFCDIEPFDDGLVFPNQDYVNASLVKDENSCRGVYIASQAPYPHNSDQLNIWGGPADYEHFWKMAYLHTDLIIGLTPAPQIYYPKLSQISLYKSMRVLTKEEERVSDSIVRRLFQVADTNTEDAPKNITLLEYNNWTDKSKPNDINDLLQLVKLIFNMSTFPVSNILIYCMAGVGRTGVLICMLEILTRSKEGTLAEFDLDDFIYFIRTRRCPFMVETVDQYAFLVNFLEKEREDCRWSRLIN
ncbi:hypothetical protein P9112_004566 [Eukaryota sp. TZLM1-RC]